MKRAFVAWSAFWGAILAILCACAVVFALKEFRSEIFVREMGLIFDVEIDHSRIIGLNEAKKLPHRFVHRIEPKGKIPPIKGILNVQIHALEPTLGGGQHRACAQ